MLEPLDDVEKITELITALWKNLGKVPPIIAAPFLDSAYEYTNWFGSGFSIQQVHNRLKRYNDEGMILLVKDPFKDESFWLVYTKKNHF